MKTKSKLVFLYRLKKVIESIINKETHDMNDIDQMCGLCKLVRDNIIYYSFEKTIHFLKSERLIEEPSLSVFWFLNGICPSSFVIYCKYDYGILNDYLSDETISEIVNRWYSPRLEFIDRLIVKYESNKDNSFIGVIKRFFGYE